MTGKTFAEKIFGAPAGSIVFAAPDIVLTHDNTASIYATFKKMGGEKPLYPDRLLVVLDHNAPPTDAKLANDYQAIRDLVAQFGITRFHDVGEGICHQLMANYARPKMIIVGSDSHTGTAGAFNAFAAGIDRTESAGLWKMGETWFRVPDTLKITLHGKLPQGVYAKDLALWIIGMIGSSGADYLSIEYHGDGVASLSVADRMVLANLASEMGAKNAVFPADAVLQQHLGEPLNGIWADPDARYIREIEISLPDIFPVVAAPHHVDNVKAISEVAGKSVQQALIGTCTNGRIEDLREAAAVLKGKKIPKFMQLLVIPASREIYLQAMKEGLVETFIDAGANVLSSSCGPCLGTGQGIPADGYTVISTANRNFKGRMGNPNASVYLASPATVAMSALEGKIADPRGGDHHDTYPFHIPQSATVDIRECEERYTMNIWNYADVDNLNTDQMFAGNLTYTIKSSEPEKILPHLFAGLDASFPNRVKPGDILMAGSNFGCGSSREHPAVGLAHAGVKAVICKSVNRIFYRSSVNQGLPIILLPEALEAYKHGDPVEIDFDGGTVTVAGTVFRFAPLPSKLMDIFNAKGLVQNIRSLYAQAMTLSITRLLRVTLFIAGTILLVWVLKMSFPKNSGALNLLLPLLLLDALLWLDTRQRIEWLPTAWRRIVTLLYWFPLILVLTGVAAGFFSTFYYWPVFVKTYLTSFVLIAYLTKILPIITLILTWLVRGLVTLVRLIACRTIYPVPRLRGLLIAGWLSGATLFGLMMAGMVWWQDDFTVKKVEIQLPELPVSFSGYRIVQISDLHLGSWNSRESLKALVTEINTLRPDLVIFTGDLCNYTTEEAWPFQSILQQISAPDGVLAILGNHDYGDYMVWPSPDAKAQNMDDLVRFYDEMGWRLLRNASVILHRGGDSIAVLGVENWGERSRFQRLANLPAALEGVETIPVKLLLTHDPTHWDSIVSQQYPGIGVTFSGHTHGGQVGIEWNGYRWSPAQYFMKHWTGLYSKTDTNGRKQYLYVNPGAGTIGYAGRIGIRPEITFCILQ